MRSGSSRRSGRWRVTPSSTEDPFPEILRPVAGAGARATPRRSAARPSPAARSDDGAERCAAVGNHAAPCGQRLEHVGQEHAAADPRHQHRLALAGAPVRATALRLTPLAVGATLRIQDSLLEGCSRFYAEITRIREIADLAGGPAPLLFLLDEMFHGTNSHDRLVGAPGCSAACAIAAPLA